MSLATQFDLTREQIVSLFRDRVASGSRTKLTREERDTLALIFVDRLVTRQECGEDTREQIEKLCRAEKDLLEEGYPPTSINSVYLPNYTRLVKAAIEIGRLKLTEKNSHPKPWTKFDGSGSGVTQTHYALDFLTYDLQTQVELRRATTTNNNDRQDDLKPVRLESYLAKVEELLQADEPALLTIAIAALTGRRHAEVVSVGRFEETNHPYLLHFKGQQKKAEAVSFEILSLLPVRELLPVIERFRSLPEIRALAGLDDEHPAVEAFNSRVNRRVQMIFGASGLVPVLSGFKTVSIHRLRALYGAIASHYFCANNQHLHRFLQNHLGHVLSQEVGASNARATDHYFHYFLVREDGTTPITARGVKLMANPALPEPEKEASEVVPQRVEAPQFEAVEAVLQAATVEKVDVVEPAVEPLEKKEPRKRSSLRIYQDLYDRFVALLEAICPDCKTQQDRTEALLAWAEERLALPPLVKLPEPEPITIQTVNDQAKTLAWLAGEVDRWRGLVAQVEQERDQALNQVQSFEETAVKLIEELQHLRAENERLRESERKLQQFKALLGNGSNGQVEAVPMPTTKQPAKEPPAPTSNERQKEPKNSKPGGAMGRARAILLAVQEWNRLHPETTFALTGSLLKGEFGINHEAMKAFIESHQNDIWALHQESGVENERSHNRQTPQKEAFAAFKQFVKERS